MVRYPVIADYTIEKFEEELFACFRSGQVDLVIIDHLHFFNFADNETENRAIKTIINRIRTLGFNLELPIILVAHLRKKPNNSTSIVPQIEEFHGSSEITKNPTTVITMSPAYDQSPPSTYQFPTYFYFAKSRYQGELTRYVFSTMFNMRTRCYDPEYQLLRVKNYGSKVDKVFEDDIPSWAERAKREPPEDDYKLKQTGYFTKKYE